MLKQKINLQLFGGADNLLESIFETNAQAFEEFGDVNSLKETIGKFNTKLSDLGYDILLNNKQKSNYIPIDRLNEVISQRDNFKAQVQQLNQQLEQIKKAAGDNEQLKQQLQKMVDENNALLTQLEEYKLQTQIVLAAKDAINPNDILMFIDKSKLKVNKEGNVEGLEEELNRLRQEKPYLFAQTQQPKKAGVDVNSQTDTTKVDMNTLIRRTAGVSFRKNF